MKTINSLELDTIIAGGSSGKLCAALGGWCLSALIFPGSGGYIGCLGFLAACIESD